MMPSYTPDFVHSAASKAIVRTWCDLRAAADMQVNNDFEIDDIPEADWPQVWRGPWSEVAVVRV